LDGLAFVQNLPKHDPMPMARHFDLKILDVQRGSVVATAAPDERHENPFRVVQGGFAATVLDIVLGLVSITELTGDMQSVATTDLSVRYIRAIREDTGLVTVRGRTIHAGNRVVVAECRLENAEGNLCAIAQSTSLIGR
jgi:uncharacterized protein (TIGR00369 family)